MNMMDGPKFRRKHTSATRTGGRAPAPSTTPPRQTEYTDQKALIEAEERKRAEVEARLKAEAEADARQRAEAEARARAKAAEKARRKAEFEEMARAEALRRVVAAREKRQEEARLKAEHEAAERARREAAERAEREAAERAEREAAERAEREAAKRAEREAAERAEREAAERAERERARETARLNAERRAREALEEAERQKAAEQERLAEERRIAQERAAEETRLAEERAWAEQERRQAEAKAAEDARRAAEREEARSLEARKRAQAEAPPLPLTDMLPVTKPASAAPVAHASPERTAPPSHEGEPDIDRAWDGLETISVSAAHLDRNRIISASRDDPAHAAFDVLRTRLLQTLADNGWRRVAITSPGQGCGKTFTVANLAISLSRQENCRTLVMDFDMRRPSLHEVLGIRSPGSLGDVLRGKVAPEDHLTRMGENPVHAGRNIAFGLNDHVESYPSELLQDPRTVETLEAIETRFAPDVVLFDLPPALFCDDVIAFRPQFDGVLVVVGGGMTTEREIKEVERRLGERTPLLGMILNKAEGSELHRYGY